MYWYLTGLGARSCVFEDLGEIVAGGCFRGESMEGWTELTTAHKPAGTRLPTQ